MNIEEVREYCLSLKNTIECFPFDEVSLVFKVENKMFLLLPLDAEEPHVSLKCSTMWKSYGNGIRRLSRLIILIRNTGIAFIWIGIWRTRRLNVGSSTLTGR